MSGPALVDRAVRWADRPAVVDGDGSHSYAELIEASAAAAAALDPDLGGERVAYMIPPGFAHLSWQWGIWRAGGMAVPLALSHPDPELEHVLDDSRPVAVVVAPEYRDRLAPLAAPRGIHLLDPDPTGGAGPDLPMVAADAPALMLYTSGTTGRPKGVVISHANIEAQVRSLVEAWGWQADDRTLLVLPLHHIHGIVNVVSCALWSGAVCEIHAGFDADRTWDRLASRQLTVFMAVPTIYHRLIAAWEAAGPDRRAHMSEGCRGLRLMVSGSAALPVPTLERWQEISGHVLLERYGMTEIGMALSNPLEGERLPGRVGSPLPGVDVRLVGEEEDEVVEDEVAGEIQVRGANVFSEYWGRPDATRESFVEGWFRTGDVAVRSGGVYRILGRESVDILKSGAEKVSALEVEEILLRHPDVGEAAVVGVSDPEWGQRVVAAVVTSTPVVMDDLTEWCRARLAPYKVPKEIRRVDTLPRNAMGKTTKPAVARLFDSQEPGA